MSSLVAGSTNPVDDVALQQTLLAAAAAAEKLSDERPCAVCGHGDLQCEKASDRTLFKCYGCRAPIADADRIAVEVRATEAVRALGGQRHDLCCGVTLRFVKEFETLHGCRKKTTQEVVRDIIKPQTRATRCRYVELTQVVRSGVGKARVFVSHCWGASFGLIVGALRRALNDEDEALVWIDIFAVRQWDGNDSDLAFASIVGQMDALVIVAAHLECVRLLRSRSGRWCTSSELSRARLALR
jgi:hypothetical protein